MTSTLELDTRRPAAVMVMAVMVIHSVLVRSHQSTSAGSFGLVRPAWIC